MDSEQMKRAFQRPDLYEPKRIGIVGSRNFPDSGMVKDYVRRLPDGWSIVTGGAAGVDTWAEEAARERGLDVIVHRPDWNKHGKAAGPIRNAQIIADADWVVAFWDGESRGTKDSMNKARLAGKLRGIYKIPREGGA